MPTVNKTDKITKVFTVAQDLAQLLSTCGMKEFEDGVEELQFLKSIWNQGKRVRIIEMETVTGNIKYKYVEIILLNCIDVNVWDNENDCDVRMCLNHLFKMNLKTSCVIKVLIQI